MNNLLNGTQVELGNVIIAQNYRGEEVARRLVGGTYGTVTKFFLIDVDTNELKSRKQDTKEAVLEGFRITSVHAYGNEIGGVEKETYELGDIFYIMTEDGLVARQVVGGHAYDADIYFAIDPKTGERKSRTRETMEEVLDSYEIELILG